MEAINDIDCISVDSNDESYWSTLNRQALQRYKISMLCDTNKTSQILLEDLMQKHSEAFDVGTIQQVLQKKCTNNVNTWTSSLCKIDPVQLFLSTQSFCQQCSNEKQVSTNRIPLKSCSCNLGLNQTPMMVKTLSSTDKEKAEPGSLYKPKFGKPKSRILNTIPSKAEHNTPVDVFVEKDVEEENNAHKSNVAKITFKSAREQLLASNPAARRTLGATRKAQNKFISPMISAAERQESNEAISSQDDRLKHLDPKMIELIESEIIDKGNAVAWDDIAGLHLAKSVIQEAVVWPLLRPDIFTGLRRPPKGILLFGPPGTGKTLIGKCVAAQCKATFFSISASSLTSKWIGDGEKMVRALFAVASCHQPAVIFIDEIDSLLTQRSDSEHEATRRIKTEFLVQFDGAATAEEDRLLIVGATNRPQELDEAARRRLVKRLYIPLPDLDARRQIIKNLLELESNDLTEAEIEDISSKTEGYSGADMKSLCSEAAMGPIRSVPLSQIVSIRRDKVRPVSAADFLAALQRIKPSVSQDDLGQYVKWNNTYGQGF